LHGRYERDAAFDETDRQRRLAARATARGFAVVALRGELGACTGPGLSTWFCWPSTRSNDAIAAFLRSWNQALDAAQARARSPARYVLGFSNGGYFVGLVATRGLFDASAFVIAHGGPVEPVQAVGNKRPMLLLSADDDVAQDDMIRFDEELAREGWARESYARPGGHALTDGDIDSAIAFFADAGDKRPFSPHSSLHRPVRHARDAGVCPAPSPQDDASTTNDADLGISASPTGYETDSDEGSDR
jgi:predicted esterase